MRLLVTRPDPDAEETASRLRGLGHEVLLAPMLTISFSRPRAGLDAPAAILVTSRNGVRALARWPEASHWHDRPVFATGRATAAAARSAGFAHVRQANGDSADLARHFMAAVDPATRPILYPAARDRSGDLAGLLRAAGYDIDMVEAYRADAAAAFPDGIGDGLREGAVDGVLVYSRRTAEVFRALCERDGLKLGGTALLALSGRIADALQGLGGRLLVAPRPDEDALLDLLREVAR